MGEGREGEREKRREQRREEEGGGAEVTVEVESNGQTCLLEPKNKAGLMHMPRNILGQRGYRLQTGPASIPIHGLVPTARGGQGTYHGGRGPAAAMDGDVACVTGALLVLVS